MVAPFGGYLEIPTNMRNDEGSVQTASQPMEMVKSPVQTSSQDAGGGYGIEHVYAEASHMFSENCDPNVVSDRMSTPVKHNILKSPVKSKIATPCDNGLGRCPSQRKLDCDGGAHERMVGKSPGKPSAIKEAGTPLRKHLCRSPRCAANNPDYAVPVPRTYLKSKRHLLPGWQAPVNAKGKVPVSPLHRQNSSAISPAIKDEDPQEHNAEPSNENVHSGDMERAEEQIMEENQTEMSSPCKYLRFEEDVVEVEADCKSNRVDAQSERSAPSTYICEEVGHQTNSKAVEDDCMKNRGTDQANHITLSAPTCEQAEIEASSGFSDLEEVVLDSSSVNAVANNEGSGIDPANHSILSASICEHAEAEASLGSGNMDEVILDSILLKAIANNEGRHTYSDFSMLSSGGGDSAGGGDVASSECPQQPAVKGFRRLSGRRFSAENNVVASNESVSLKDQVAMKRKQADDWMWDSAIKDAVLRLAPHGDGGVNVLVQAFESIMLTEGEIQASKYMNTASNQSGLKNICHLDGYGAGETHISQAEKVCSINKVHAWDESMASSGLIDALHAQRAHYTELGSRACGTSQQGFHDYLKSIITRNGQHAEDISSSLDTVQQGRFLQSPSNSEPSKRESNRWAPGADASTNARDDLCCEKASSTSGKSGSSEWTCERRQAGFRPKHQRKRYTSLQPFRLRTEERGAIKEYEFSKRLQQLWAEEQRMRIPIAQGLPWTTDEPEVPPKPRIKEQTKVEGFQLVTDMRAVERAEFDNYVAERNLQLEVQKQEEKRERQIAEEEEVRRLRREMVPRAQLMPYFDRPFMPRRSSKRLTVPKEPNFHHKQNKRAKCMASSHVYTTSDVYST